MTFLQFETRRAAVTMIFSPVDAYALDRGLNGPRPRPVGPLKYLLTSRTDGGDPLGRFRPLELGVVRNPSGFDLFLDRARPATDPDDPNAFEPYKPGPDPLRKVNIEPGRYMLRVVSLFYAPFLIEVTYPNPRLFPDPRAVPPPSPSPDIDAMPLRPGPLYPYGPGTTTLRGAVLDGGGRGVAGAIVTATGLDQSYRTDAGGQWIFLFPPPPATPKPVPTTVDTTVRVVRPDGNVDLMATTVVYGGDNSLAQTALRGRVQAGGIGVRGATVSAGGLAVTTGDAGAFVLAFPPATPAAPVDVTATLPDGRSLTEPNFPIATGSTLILPTFRFD